MKHTEAWIEYWIETFNPWRLKIQAKKFSEDLNKYRMKHTEAWL